MASAKTMRDVRTMRSIATRRAPMTEGAVFLQLHRLCSEKLRLEREATLWLRKKERIEQRLGEIEQQMETLRRLGQSAAATPGAGGPKKAWQHVTLEY